MIKSRHDKLDELVTSQPGEMPEPIPIFFTHSGLGFVEAMSRDVDRDGNEFTHLFVIPNWNFMIMEAWTEEELNRGGKWCTLPSSMVIKTPTGFFVDSDVTGHALPILSYETDMWRQRCKGLEDELSNLKMRVHRLVNYSGSLTKNETTAEK